MNNILKNNQLLIGLILGFIINYLILLFNLILLFEFAQIVGYQLALLYFLNFTLIELIIYHNMEPSILQILEVNKTNRSLSITMTNDNLLTGEELFKGIYNTIMKNEEFTNFGFQKIIILSCTLEDFKELNLHSNVLIDNNTTFIEYYNSIINDLSGYNNLEYGYQNLNIVRFTIKAWNCDNLNNLNIKITNNSISMVKKITNINNIFYLTNIFILGIIF